MQADDSSSHVWRKSGRSANGNCVEVASTGQDLLWVRDSKDVDGPVLRFSRQEWTRFLKQLKS
ncbi:DUF397 domain-containing protein [Sphaerisporangium corydalis]|uniref:DUF397 domain-containing protein n=1 Tax=Sphaerisporangium corydalis TaxID=1441875 RepID=A0ABV9EKU3_9ACTN|nr:DUF397 domain-containing protein [Sphaerisporangium corydalis]